MNLNSNKKIVLLGIVLLILAGIIVVALKGMNVNLMLAKHKSVDMVIGKEFNVNDIETICKEIFDNKKVVVKKVETFSDAVNISATSISDEEKAKLVEKINEKYETKLVASEITVKSNSNIRIRDIIKPYILPSLISFVLIYAYIGIRFKKLNPLKVLLEITAILVITEIVIASIVAIIRVPVSPIVINIMFAISVAEISLFISKKEKELKNI